MVMTHRDPPAPNIEEDEIQGDVLIGLQKTGGGVLFFRIRNPALSEPR